MSARVPRSLRLSRNPLFVRLKMVSLKRFMEGMVITEGVPMAVLSYSGPSKGRRYTTRDQRRGG